MKFPLFLAACLLSSGLNLSEALAVLPKHPLKEELDRARDEANAQTKAKGRTVSRGEILYADPTWEERMAQYIVELVTRSQYDGAIDEISKRVASAHETKSFGASYIQLQEEEEREIERWGRCDQARNTLNSLLTELSYTHDARAVRFFGPLLKLKSILPATRGRDHYVIPEAAARSALSWMRKGGVIQATGHPLRPYDVDWIKWWDENREKYGPVPKALQAIEDAATGMASTQDGSKSDGTKAMVLSTHFPPAPKSPARSSSPSEMSQTHSIIFCAIAGTVVAGFALLGWCFSRQARKR